MSNIGWLSLGWLLVSVLLVVWSRRVTIKKTPQQLEGNSTAWLPDDLLMEFAILCKRRRRTQQDVVTQLVAQWVQEGR